MDKIKIRIMTPDEIPQVVDMIKALNAFHNYKGYVTEASLGRDTAGPDPWFTVYVAQSADVLVGYMILLPLAKIADGLRGLDINHMYVAETHRGKGIARLFVQTAIARARDLSCGYIFISTSVENTAAQSAYQAIGFEPRPDPGGPRFRLQI